MASKAKLQAVVAELKALGQPDVAQAAEQVVGFGLGGGRPGGNITKPGNISWSERNGITFSAGKVDKDAIEKLRKLADKDAQFTISQLTQRLKKAVVGRRVEIEERIEKLKKPLSTEELLEDYGDSLPNVIHSLPWRGTIDSFVKELEKTIKWLQAHKDYGITTEID